VAGIEVRLNPDVTPSGSDLAVVNSARRSFNTRSEWDFNPCATGKVLKDKDKRLIQFLARGMTADDFDRFLGDIEGVVEYIPMQGDNTDYQKLMDLLWQWRNTPTHDTPFNHCFISFEIKVPVFTARQLVKTEYTVLSEISRRYITSEIEFYEHTYRNQSK